jgi:beta-lactam-binding protein with PASTA domain
MLTVAEAPDTVRLPRVVGDRPSAATSTLNGLGLNVNTAYTTVHNPANVGIVVQQSPGSTTVVKKGSSVTITVGQAAAGSSGSTGVSSGGNSANSGGASTNSGVPGTSGGSNRTTSTTTSTPTTTPTTATS